MTLREFHVWPVILAIGLVGLGVARAQAETPGASDLRLVMVEEYGCRFCRLWDADVGLVYAKSPEGRAAPLKRVQRQAAELATFKPAIFTPLSWRGAITRSAGLPAIPAKVSSGKSLENS